MPISSRCFAPSRGFFSKDGKCGRESVENGLCEFHWNILCCAPPNPAKSFPFCDKCKICGMCVRGFYENGICESCMPSSESKNITIRSIIKSLHNKPSNFSKCDDKIIELMKRELVKHNNGIPRYFNIRFNAREKKIHIFDEDGQMIDEIRYNHNFELI